LRSGAPRGRPPGDGSRPPRRSSSGCGSSPRRSSIRRADVPAARRWTYACQRRRLLAGKGFAVSERSSTFPPAQIAWGTLFAALGGFSFTTLRLSTARARALGTVAFTPLLRALGCSAGRRSRPRSRSPSTRSLRPSFTFMTDVAPVAALRRESRRDRARSRGRARRTRDGSRARARRVLVRPVAVAIRGVLATAALQAGAAGDRAPPCSRRDARRDGGRDPRSRRDTGCTVAGGEGGLADRLERLR